MASLLDMMGDMPKSYNRDGGHVVTFARGHGPVEVALASCRSRIVFAMAVFLFAAAVIVGRLVEVGMLRDGSTGKAFQVSRHSKITSARADVVDRNGVLLAANLSTHSLYAVPNMIKDPDATAASLAKIFPDLKASSLAKQLRSDKKFMWIKRGITPEQHFEVNRLGQPGLNFQPEESRIYPQGSLFSHVLGYVNVDNRGIAGVEKSLDNIMAGEDRGDEPVQLALDIRVQHALHDLLWQGMRDYSAKGAVGVVMDVNSGEILAMTSLPDFDPHYPSDEPDSSRFNKATLGVYEMGSTFKTLTIAMALDSGRVKITDSFDATAPIKFGGNTIHDFHAQNRWLTVPEVIKYSSNIGTAKIAAVVGAQKQQEYFRKLGLFDPVAVELPERGVPMFPKRWSEITMMTTSYGHGIAVSPLHLARATAAAVNGGMLVQPTILKIAEGKKPVAERVFKEETAIHMRNLLRLVVSEGTGKSSDVQGYMVGGKTGTAEKTTAGGYSKKAVLTAFAATFPSNDPKYFTLVMFDEPQPTAKTMNMSTAGWNAAPITGKLIERIAPMLGVMPFDYEEKIMADHSIMMQEEN